MSDISKGLAGTSIAGLITQEVKTSGSGIASTAGATGTLAYRVDAVGRMVHVYLTANVTGTSSGTSQYATAIPAAYRPAEDSFMWGVFASNIVYIAEIEADGDVILYRRIIDAGGLASSSFANTAQENDLSFNLFYPLAGS